MQHIGAQATGYSCLLAPCHVVHAVVPMLFVLQATIISCGGGLGTRLTSVTLASTVFH